MNIRSVCLVDDRKVQKTNPVPDWFVFHDSHGVKSEKRLPSEVCVIVGNDLNRARFRLTDKGDSTAAESGDFFGGSKFRMDLVDEPVCAPCRVIDLRNLPSTNHARCMRVDFNNECSRLNNKCDRITAHHHGL